MIGKRAAAGMRECRAGQVVIASVPMQLDGPCDVFDLKRLRRTGSLAINGAKIVTARDRSGWRVWNSRPRRAKQRVAKAQ